ncbi:MAG: HAD family hydrolase [Verrucomicrobiales bacterium]|nr:HAD family hydrolase [Verrucomicrobiales bacterium]
MVSPPIQAVAFDLDNTLIDRDAAFLRLIKDWVAVIYGKKHSLINHILEQDDHGHSNRDELFQFLAQMNIFGGNSVGLKNRFAREFPGYFASSSEVHDLLKRLQERGIELALLTNGGAQIQREKLERASLTGFFDPEKILVSGEIGFDKPAPEAFAALNKKMNTPPANTLFVGDHFEKDIVGASTAGFQTCWITPDVENRVNDSSVFDFQISTLSELEITCLT